MSSSEYSQTVLKPEHTYVFFDLEATSTNIEKAEIVEIAAIVPGGEERRWYVATKADYPADHEVWNITKIDPEVYKRLKVPLRQALQEFLGFIGQRPLAGHNILRYDLPLLRQYLQQEGLELPHTELPPLDTLRWAHLLFPVPPDDLGGYSLGKIHEKLIGQPIFNAHEALNDCRANASVARALQTVLLREETRKLWSWLELPEVKWHGFSSVEADELQQLLNHPAKVPWVNESGCTFPPPGSIGNDLLESRRPGQDQMMEVVLQTLSGGKRTLIQAPTGTGKTRGYLYPAHYHSQKDRQTKTVIATHTKVLQQQALEELQRSADKGYQTKAVVVKSPREYICLEALFEQLEAKTQGSEEERYALGVLGYYAQQGGFDLGALPPYWDYSAAFREVRFNIQTNPNRCRPECPFYHQCAYQTDLRQRNQSDFWITNQAWLMAHFGHAEVEHDAASQVHLIIDEAHNLEDVATQAFSQTFGEEDSKLHLLRIFDQKRRRGWLRDTSRVDKSQQEVAGRIRHTLIPDALERLEKYSEALARFLKQHGRGDLQYGLSIALGPEIRKKPDWAKLRILEDAWIEALKALRQALLEFPRNSWLERNLRESSEFFQQQIDLLYERRAHLRELVSEEADPNLIHLTEYHPETGWKHSAIPIDITPALSQVWQQANSLTLTSATLAIGSDFSYIKRALGLEEAETVSIPESLPYEKARVVVPRHLPESRSSTQRRFQSLYHIELETLLPKLHRSLTLFTSAQRMREAKEYLEKSVNDLYVPLTRREREDIARYMSDRNRRGAALGTRAYMEGVDFRDLQVVNLERIPFPIPSTLLEKRQDLARQKGLDPWADVYLPKALLTFIQAFGRLVRDDRQQVGDGVFILWDKRLLNASYQQAFFRALPKGVPNPVLPESRQEFYQVLANVLKLDTSDLPSEELRDEHQLQLEEIRRASKPPLDKAMAIAQTFWNITLGQDERSQRQLEAIQADLEARDLMVLLPTSYGKSLTFQLPALTSGGLTLVVSPLIALMKDQVEQLQKKGLPAAALHSFLSGAEQRSILDEVRSGRINLLYVSPERVNRGRDLQQMLREASQKGVIRRVVLDEAHCLSMWGQDFRPDYVQMCGVLRELCPDVPISALTATATPKVVEDLNQLLALRQPLTVTTSFDRPNLSYYSYKLNEIKKFQQLCQILSWLEGSGPEGNAIVYASTRNQVERLAWALRELGYSASAYHAGLSPLVRSEVQEQFMSGVVQVMVATNAFGMGVDKENVRVVVHFNPPPNLAAYIQEAGRAGRDGQPAYAVLLYNNADWNLADFLNRVGQIKDHHASALLTVLEKHNGCWVGYRSGLIEAINGELSEEESDLDADQLSRLLGAMAAAEVFSMRYRVGKVFVLCDDLEQLATELGNQKLQTLKTIGLTGAALGDELDFISLNPEEAEQLDEHLFKLWRQGKLRLYANREAALMLEQRDSSQVQTRRRQFEQQQKGLQKTRKEQLEEVKSYAESNHCKRRLLLKAYNEELAECTGCQSCNGDDAPWKGTLQFEPEELETVYRPLETVLRYLEANRNVLYGKGIEAESGGLGRVKLIMALRGEEQSYNPNKPIKLSRYQIANPYFGHLKFVREGEIEKAIKVAVGQGLVIETPFNPNGASQGQGMVYSISEKGLQYLRRQRKRKRDGGK